MTQCSHSRESCRSSTAEATILDYWLRTAGSIPLLTPAEELHLSRLIRRGQRLDATAAEKRAEKRAIERMIKGNLRLVVKVAKSFHYRTERTYLKMEDLLQEGCIGLHRAAERFDPEVGCKFSTYAYWWIRERIGTVIDDATGTARLPRKMSQRLRKSGSQGHESLSAEGSRVDTLKGLHLRPISLDAPVYESMNVSLIDMIESHDAQDAYQDIDLSSAIRSLKSSKEDFQLIYQWVICDRTLDHLARDSGISRQAMAGRIKRGCKRLAGVAAGHHNLVAG